MIVDNSDYSVEGLVGVISNAQMVVSARYHGAVHALICCKPLIIIGWAGKYRHLVQLFDLRNNLMDLQHQKIEDIDVNGFVEELIAEKEFISQKIADRLEQIRRDSFWNQIVLKS